VRVSLAQFDPSVAQDDRGNGPRARLEVGRVRATPGEQDRVRAEQGVELGPDERVARTEDGRRFAAKASLAASTNSVISVSGCCASGR
jgi:hypothetical protein